MKIAWTLANITANFLGLIMEENELILKTSTLKYFRVMFKNSTTKRVHV